MSQPTKDWETADDFFYRWYITMDSTTAEDDIRIDLANILSDARTEGAEAMRQYVSERLDWIYRCSRDRLEQIELPKRVDAMNEDEAAIYNAMSVAVGALMSARDWAEEAIASLPTPEGDTTTTEDTGEETQT